MTKKKQRTQNSIDIGNIFYEYRKQLSLKNSSRAYFIADREEKGLLDEGWISEKTLTNIENGYNLPNLVTLKLLAIALEVDFIDLIRKLEPYLVKDEI